ncbi:MAG: nitrate reductase NapAB chaperone NapD [Mariniblastus sp.]|jgi:nitrate reductase NapAB chaperone NapD
MISSLIARLNVDARPLAATISEIESQPGIEIGELVDNRLLPVTLESPGSHEMENTTRLIQSLTGVDFVDVVYVHFDEPVIPGAGET